MVTNFKMNKEKGKLLAWSIIFLSLFLYTTIADSNTEVISEMVFTIIVWLFCGWRFVVNMGDLFK